MSEYIATKLPTDIQVLLAVEAPTTLRFDKVIEIDEAYHLLEADQYHRIYESMRPFTDAMYNNLLGNGDPAEAERAS